MHKAKKVFRNNSRDNKRALALELYMNSDLNQKQICEIIGWTEKTFSENKIKFGWDELKGATTITPHKIISKLYKRLDTMTEEGMPLAADEIIKIAKSIEKLTDKRTTISHIINVFKEFNTFVMGRDGDLGKKVNDLMNEFIAGKING